METREAEDENILLEKIFVYCLLRRLILNNIHINREFVNVLLRFIQTVGVFAPLL